jgi:predicted nucleic acid-binding protein
MNNTFVDTNVLLDLTTRNSPFYDWSSQTLGREGRGRVLSINEIVYAELCGGFLSMAPADDLLATLNVEILVAPKTALFLASRAFKTYKRRGGTRTGVLPDFFIGAHAHVLNVPLITRDTARYQTYFPTLQLIAPPL